MIFFLCLNQHLFNFSKLHVPGNLKRRSAVLCLCVSEHTPGYVRSSPTASFLFKYTASSRGSEHYTLFKQSGKSTRITKAEIMHFFIFSSIFSLKMSGLRSLFPKNFY